VLQTTPATGTTFFKGNEITIRFDEYVQLKDLSNQLMISPRFKTTPEVSATGKEVTIEFDPKDLLPNTTYRIDFGKAIADMNESNSLNAFTYVFSTGAVIDSLEIRGVVTAANNNATQGDVLIGLYKPNDTLRTAQKDSVVFLLPPDYSTRTDASGNFRIGNLPVASYELYAIRDNNRNSLYDGVSEKVAFAGKVNSGSDSSVKVNLFQEDPAKLFVKRAFSPFYGFAQIILNKPASDRIRTLAGNQSDIYVPKSNVPRDTISIFYRDVKDTLGLLLGFEDLGRTDTIRIVLPDAKPAKKRLRTITSSASGGVLGVNSELDLRFPVWMDTASLLLSKLRIQSNDDSLIKTKTVRGRWLDVHTLRIEAPFKPGVSYSLIGDTGMVHDLSGTSNDSNLIVIRRQMQADLSKLTLKVMVPRKQAYVIQLINQQEAVVAFHSFAVALSATNLVSLEFPAVQPGTYKAKLIFDDNANGRWDTGNLVSKRQPEKVIVSTKDLKLLSDWEIEELVEFKD
jgi:hypothetical protein